MVGREPAVNSRSERRQRTTLRLPYMQAEGPKCPEPMPAGAVAEEEVIRLQGRWSDMLQEAESAEVLLEGLRLVTRTTYLYLEEIHAAFDAWVLQLSESTTLETLAACTRFRHLADIEWLLSGISLSAISNESTTRFFRREAELLHELHAPLPKNVSYHPKVFAHLFSGARRTGDFKQHVEALQAMAISVDIIFDVTWGNLLKPETFDLFVRAMNERILSGFLSGPPCETWSRARAYDEDGPRILRSRERLQGLPFLTRRETEQVSIGNQLLGVTLRLFLVALLTGTLAILEHPACPDDDARLPSIWYLEVIRCLLRFPGCVKL